jgi:genome maintenance exonuclease 1
MKTNEDVKLLSVEAENKGRFYQSPTSGKWYPSVTTVVNHEDAEKWAKWRENPENLKISQAAIQRGNRLHALVEDYLKEGTIPTDVSERWHFDPMLPLLQNIGKIYAIEKPLWSDHLMLAGRTDCIGEYLGEPAIIDFKTSSKEKKKSWIKNYFRQAAAYSYMWEERTGQRINRLVVLITTDEGTSQEFVEEREDHKEGLASVINSYWKKNGFKTIQEIANELAQKAS